MASEKSAAAANPSDALSGLATGQYPPVDTTAAQLTVRAVVTGMILGGVLSLCNVYSGLLIGWGFNMSITAALLGFGFWQSLHLVLNSKEFGILENNINQTAASSAASISSAGLVAPIPALTMLTGYQFTWGVLAVWTFIITLCGIVVAIGLRRQMLIVDALPFPNGIATAETVKRMYARGSEAMAQVKMLLGGASVAAVVKLLVTLIPIPKAAMPGAFAATGAAAQAGARTITLKNLTFALDPSMLLAAVGAIIGMRAAASMLLGAVISWGLLGPWVLSLGWAAIGTNAEGAVLVDAPWYGTTMKWLLWPGVSMMVSASLTSFAFSWRSVLAAIRGTGGDADETGPGDAHNGNETDEVPRSYFLAGLGIVLVAATAAQMAFFGITWWTAIFGVLMTFLLAIVAARVAGETGVTPVGAMGKVTQLTFGLISPGDATSNLMAANVTGGAASQCADLLHDMKTGLMIGASPRLQSFAQVFGALSGALVGCWAYLLIIPDPQTMLLTEEWPAPAVAAWKAVAEIFMSGIDAMPEGAINAIFIAGAAGIALAIAEKTLPKKFAQWTPSPAAMGLAFVIPAWNSMSMFFGAVVALLVTKYAETWSERFLIVLASGLIAGESLTGVGIAIQKVIANVAG
ncbi:MAG: OPT/YSL family transporter [Deltaproteobacteria bacterium]|nr:OPT/YSL family transporter [Deltaproteobacteria bacterium]